MTCLKEDASGRSIHAEKFSKPLPVFVLLLCPHLPTRSFGRLMVDLQVALNICDTPSAVSRKKSERAQQKTQVETSSAKS